MAWPPFPHQAMEGKPSHSFWRLSSGTRKQQKLNLGHQWSVVSRISQMQAWAIPAVRKSTDPHGGPLICCLATRATCVGEVEFARGWLQDSSVGDAGSWCEAEGGRKGAELQASRIGRD